MNTAEYLVVGGAAGSVAVLDSDGAHSYAGLRGEVGRRITALDGLGLRPGDRVALVGPNGFGWVASYLAVLAAGMVAVPIPHTLLPAEAVSRVQWLGVKAAFAGPLETRRLAGRLPGTLPLRWDGVPAAEAAIPFVDVSSGQDAVLEFTSGTTGSPRVVRLTHGNLQANTESILGYLGLSSTDRVLVVLPFSYVFGASLLHTHLRTGAAMVVQPNAAFPQQIVETLAAEHCTGFAGVPSTFSVLLRNSTFADRPLPRLRLIQQAGGRLAPAMVEELRRAQPQARLFLMYGQTEATARLSCLPPEDLDRRPGSIGRGIPGVSLRVVGEDGRDVAPGQVGEIRARGANISPGYLNDAEETARRMPGGELRTGDLATVDEDGYLYVVDRREDFIKSWGVRISSQEIEAVALQLTDLVSVAVVGVPDEAAGERVEMVAALRDGSSLTASDVIDHCRAGLARHMVPSVVHLVASIPLSSNGKVSKNTVREFCIDLGIDPASADQSPGGPS
ncbi:class I adenylate-forming enzyme family protein [Acidipropionibacterium virtanenii]|uniref:Long-chain-fatty-acid--CoA ligase n=1 Tax=Acidipropionibacterium virtanenii TaxID=2057246 RepID=A0A344UTU6_9ACTN|nr:AMP-binding protein [Acidipropionibacterium virtanenii]AXE38694.1 Long-chain-fatty-acid--CoA ligase [Acidipropionibacterium virtanenii]